LLAEGQSREAYNKATASVYANWEMGIGKLFADKPDGTRWSDESDESQANEDPRPVSGLVGIFSFDWFGDEEDKEDTSDLPEDPSVSEIANDKIILYRDTIKSLPLLTPYGKPIRSGILKGIRDWGIDVIAGGISLAAHDTIKKVEPTANADASFFLNWFGTSSIPSMMMGYNKVGIQSVDYVQSIARENALELNTGHAGLGSTSTILLDNVVIEGITSLVTLGATNVFTKGAQLSRRISQEISESTIDVVQRIDDDVAQVIAKAGKSLDTADAIPLEKLAEIAPNRYLPKIQNLGDEVSSWLGKDAKVITNDGGDTIIQSVDGLREIRFDFNHTYPHKNPHTHLIEYKMVKNKKVEITNRRIYPAGVTPE
jgi:hypothetical protein